MKVVKYIFPVFFVFILCISNPFENSVSVIYRNSFESAEDTKAWSSLSEYDLVNEPAPTCGMKSVFLQQACVHPTTYLELPPSGEDSNYRLSFWAKLVDKSKTGSAFFYVSGEENENRIKIEIDKDEWHFYQTEKSLFCPADKKLKILIDLPGGISFSSSMYFDFVSIVKISK